MGHLAKKMLVGTRKKREFEEIIRKVCLSEKGSVMIRTGD